MTEAIAPIKLQATETAPGHFVFNQTTIAPAKPVEAVTEPVRVSHEPEHVGLLDLSDRTLARLALRASWYDMRNFHRTDMYGLFKAKLKDERDARAMQDLHIVDAVHCRLHERVVAKARGL